MNYRETLREINEAGVDYPDYVLGTMGATWAIGMVGWLTSPIPSKTLALLGGIGLFITYAFELNR